MKSRVKKKEIGHCHICGKYGELSFEHIPPQKALNKYKAITYTGDDVLKRYKGEKSRYKQLQKGMGKYTLCEQCNNSMGAWYADFYSDVAIDVARILHKREPLKHGDYISFSSENFPAMAFVKQVISMFCSLLPLKEVQRLGFDKFLLDKESKIMDSSLFDLKMYLTPIKTGQLMVGPCVIGKITPSGTEPTIACDLGVYPFGFILNLTPQYEIEYGVSINNLLDTEYGKGYKVNITLQYLERTSDTMPMPLIFKPLPNDEINK